MHAAGKESKNISNMRNQYRHENQKRQPLLASDYQVTP
jgi:hypothetical protein